MKEFSKEKVLCKLHVIIGMLFSPRSDAVRNYNLWTCQKVCEVFTVLLDNIYIRFGSKLYRQIVGLPMGTNCAPLVADLFFYESDFMLSLSDDNQTEVIEAFNSTSRYMDDLSNIDNNFFDSMVNHIYPLKLQLNKANVSDIEALFLDLIFSSPEPKAPGELIGWEGSVVRRPSVRPSVRPSSVVRPQFQTTSPLKLLGRLQLNFIYSLQGL